MHVHPKMSCFLALSALLLTPMAAALDTQPNVILVMTDDQGHGDLSLHGNPCLQTPNLDRLAAQSARLGTFYVQPVCAPTRAALMTGQVPQRTTAIDTYIGRAMLSPEEVTRCNKSPLNPDNSVILQAGSLASSYLPVSW